MKPIRRWRLIWLPWSAPAFTVGTFVSRDERDKKTGEITKVSKKVREFKYLSLRVFLLISPYVIHYYRTMQLLLPFLLQTLVYEKQHRLRTMMRMHGLNDRCISPW